MSDLKVPSYRYHAARRCAVVTLSGQDFYLGTHNSTESKAEYQRVVGERLSRGRTPLPTNASRGGLAGPSVNEIILAYVTIAADYRDGDGQRTREVEMMKLAYRPLLALYGHTPANAFGPLALQTVRDRMIKSGLARTVINQRIGFVKRLFAWASEKELIHPSVYHGLVCVKGLRHGRTAVKETKPVEPVPYERVDATLPFLPPILRAMAGLQRLTGMRSGELVRMRTREISITVDAKGEEEWIFCPEKHKTKHMGRERIIPFGPRCQAILRPFRNLDTSAYLFSPRQAEAERDGIMRAVRKTPVQPSQINRRKAKPKRSPGAVYDTRSYYAALRFGMRAAMKAKKLDKSQFWHPHQLRHSAALCISREMGLDGARAFLGHAKPDMTAHYAGLDKMLASIVAKKCG
jgi:integrase